MLTPQELAGMLEDTGGVAVECGGVSTFGHREVRDDVALEDGAEVMVEIDAVRVATGILPTLAQDTAITVDGEAFVIGEARRVDNGHFTLIDLVAP